MTRSHAFAGCIQSGTGFPDGWGFGKCVPEFAFGMGCSFPTEPQAETASHSGREFWDTVSGCKKGHKTWPSTYICCGYPPHDKPRSNNRASVRAEAYKVHREFRTQRKALNVLSERAQDLTERKPCAWPSAERAGWWNCVQPGFPLTDAGVPAIILSVHARIRCQRQPVPNRA